MLVELFKKPQCNHNGNPGLVGVCPQWYLGRTLLVHIITEILQLRIDMRQTEISELSVQSSLSYLRRENLQRSRSLDGQTMSVLLCLDHPKILNYSLEMAKDTRQTICVDHTGDE